MTFRERENEQRVAALRNDAGDQDFLERLNDMLQGDPLAQPTAGGPALPIVFVTGLPRGGTTLLMQVLAAGLDVGFVDCIAARFWRAPVCGLRLSRQLSRGAPAFTFESDHGTPRSPFEPHEFSYFWQHWFERDAIDWAGLAGTIAAMQRETGRPLLLKGLAALGRLPELAARVARSMFVHIERDPADTAASLLAARRRYYGDEGQWWSLEPRRRAELEGLAPADEVAGQVRLLREQFTDELARVGAARVVRLTYEELCRGADDVVDRVRIAARSAFGVDIGRRRAALPLFEVRRPAARETAPVPHTRVEFDDVAAERVAALVRQGRPATGEEVARLEDDLSARLDGRHVACVSSGLAALQMILVALGGASRRVAMPSFACEALALAAHHAGTPANFLDVDPATMNLAAGTTAEDVLVAVHSWGVPAPVDTMRAPTIIEDLAHAVGATMDGTPCGTIADLAFTSFYATKLVAGAYGGAVIASDAAFVETIRDRRQYNHRERYRADRFQLPMSDLSAALARRSLAGLDEAIARRTEIAASYDEALAGSGAVRQAVPEHAAPAWYRYVVTVPDADRLLAAATASGIGIAHAMGRGQHELAGDGERLPVAEHLCRHAVSLPIYPGLAPPERRRVIETIRAAR